MVVLPSVSLVVGLFPTIGPTKKALIPTPGLFIEPNYAVSFNNLCRKYREPDLHCVNKKTGIPILFRKKKKKKPSTTTTGDIVSRKALDFSRRLPRGGW